MLRLLGIEPDKHLHTSNSGKTLAPIDIKMDYNVSPYSPMDCYRRKICAYKFAIESIIEGGTRFSDQFLQKKYFEIILENNVRKKLENQIASEKMLTEALESEADRLGNYFQFAIDSEKMDIISNARAYIRKYVLYDGQRKRFPELRKEDVERMQKREVFLNLRLRDDSGRNILEGKFETTTSETERLLSKTALKKESFEKCANLWCQWCASREICLELYLSTSD